jgi:hypothetical protein
MYIPMRTCSERLICRLSAIRLPKSLFGRSFAVGVANRIDADSICGKSSGSKGSDVVIAGHLGPVALEDLAAERIDLAEGDGAEASGSLKAERKAADARKKIKYLEHRTHPRGDMSSKRDRKA